MAVPTTIADLSTTASSNSPAGTDSVTDAAGPDDYLRAHAAIIKQLETDSGAALAKTDGNFIVGNGTAWVAESGATARASLGLTIGTNVQAYDAQLDTLSGITAQQATDLASLSTFVGTILNDANGDAVFTTMGAADTQAASGYQKFPSGVIVQWGLDTSSASAGVAVSFALAFPTLCAAVVVTHNGAVAADVAASARSTGVSGFTLDAYTASSGARVSAACGWIAVGY